MTYSNMYDYYTDAGFLPTYARLRTVADLDAHAAARERFLTDKMYLPARLFSGARLIEYGPDSGENALAFARFGSHVTLVEPNTNCHPIIREYFSRYHLTPWLEKIEADDIAGYAKRNLKPEYDFIDAEGFIYSIQPSSLWIDLFAKLLRPGGLALISYYELYGGWVELFTKRIYARVLELTGKPGLEIAHALFDNKWALIPHQRSFDQWFADVILNPFVSREFFLEAEELCQAFERHGFHLYSSWPQYRPPLAYWHKLKEPVGSRARFIEQQRISWKYGNNTGAAAECVIQLEHHLKYGTPDTIIHYCQTDPVWLRLYGQPNQFATFQRV